MAYVMVVIWTCYTKILSHSSKTWSNPNNMYVITLMQLLSSRLTFDFLCCNRILWNYDPSTVSKTFESGWSIWLNLNFRIVNHQLVSPYIKPKWYVITFSCNYSAQDWHLTSFVVIESYHCGQSTLLELAARVELNSWLAS